MKRDTRTQNATPELDAQPQHKRCNTHFWQWISVECQSRDWQWLTAQFIEHKHWWHQFSSRSWHLLVACNYSVHVVCITPRLRSSVCVTYKFLVIENLMSLIPIKTTWMGGSSKPLRPDQGHNTQKTYWLKPESKDVRKQPSLLLITLAYQPESQLGLYLQETKPSNLTRTKNIKKNIHTQHVNRHWNIQLIQLTQLI